MAMEAFYRSGFTLGILGGGQLGRMLIQSAIPLNIHTAVLDGDADAPCHPFATHFTQGSFRDYDDVMQFGEKADVITIEIEHVNVNALEQLAAQGKKVYPQPHIIRLIQDKGLQKQFLQDNGFPTADFRLLESKEALSENKDFLPAFQKLRTAGYDGRGVMALRQESDLEKALDGPCLVEKAVDCRHELSVIVARGRAGEVKVFPPVEQVFHPEKHLLAYLASPAGIDKATVGEAIQLAKAIAQKLGIVGLLAIEMFVDHEGNLLVNEMAPRPHNSGHQSIEGNTTSQYEQHLRAILGLPLGATDIVSPALMINLLGADGHSGPVYYEGLEEVLRLPGAHVHLYGKEETRPFRKMGHVTLTGRSVEELQERAQFVEKTLKVKSWPKQQL